MSKFDIVLCYIPINATTSTFVPLAVVYLEETMIPHQKHSRYCLFLDGTNIQKARVSLFPASDPEHKQMRSNFEMINRVGV